MQPGDAPQRPTVARRRSWLVPSLVGGYLAAVTLFMVFVLHISVSPERFLLLMLTLHMSRPHFMAVMDLHLCSGVLCVALICATRKIKSHI